MLRRPRRLGRMLVGVLLLAMGLGALVKPPAPTPGFVNPSKIAACLTPLGYSVGTLQKVPGELWQAVSAKPLFHGDYGDVNLFVSGPSERIARAVELEANACADRWPVARAELLRALPFLLEHLRLPISAELFQVIEADTGERAGTAEFMVGSAKVICATGAPVGDLRSARVSLARKQPRMERTMRKTMALLGSCHLLLPGLRGPEPVKEPEIVRVRLKPQDQAASAGPQPIPDVARVFAVIYLQEALKDVDSAKIQWGSDLRLATWFEHDAAVKDVRTYREVAGWKFFANVNAKNGFGAYAGWQSWRFRFRQDRLAAAEPVSAAPLR